jgi:hypothetical protein
MPLNEEIEIVNYLALILATLGDPLKVIAVCVEDVENRNGITIMVSANIYSLYLVASLKTFSSHLEMTAHKFEECI